MIKRSVASDSAESQERGSKALSIIWARDRRMEDRQELIERFIPLCWKIVKQKHVCKNNLEDAKSSAYEGLIWAADHYDCAKGRFMTYAFQIIECFVLNFMIQSTTQTSSLHYGRTAHDWETWSAHERAEGRIPTVEQFPKAPCVNNDTVDIAMRARNVTNFSAFTHRDPQDPINVAITQDPDHADRLHFHELAEKAMRYIHPDHRDIVKAKILDGLTLIETAQAFGISKQRVHQIITKELRHVRERMERDGIIEDDVF